MNRISHSVFREKAKGKGAGKITNDEIRIPRYALRNTVVLNLAVHQFAKVQKDLNDNPDEGGDDDGREEGEEKNPFG